MAGRVRRDMLLDLVELFGLLAGIIDLWLDG